MLITIGLHRDINERLYHGECDAGIRITQENRVERSLTNWLKAICVRKHNHIIKTKTTNKTITTTIISITQQQLLSTRAHYIRVTQREAT